MKIGELAQRTGLTVKALHHYEEEGLLVPSARTPAGHRLYDSADLERLQRILALRSLGLSLAEVRTALEGDVRPVLEERHQALQRTLARVQGQCRVMAALLARLEVGHPSASRRSRRSTTSRRPAGEPR